MSTRKVGLLAALLSGVVLVASGCSSFRAPTISSGSTSTFVLRVNWKLLAAIHRPQRSWVFAFLTPKAIAASAEPEITMVGARLVYPDQGAAFSQAVTKQVAEQEGVITLRVPPANRAHLFVVAAGANQVVRFGIEYALAIPEGSTVTRTVDMLVWRSAMWEDTSPYRLHLMGSDANITPGPGETKVVFPIRVYNPFGPEYVGASAAWERSAWDPAGWSEFTMFCEKGMWTRKPENWCHVQPYLDGKLFNLAGSLLIPPIVGDFTVNWQ